MVKHKNHKKHTKKGHNGNELQQSSAPNSPTRNSPRRRRRNMNMLSTEDYKLRQEIEHGGRLTIVDMESDGNCLFRSISDQLYYDYGNNHDEIRHDICDFIEDHKDDFIFFLVLDDKDAAENDEDASDFESYVANMRHDGDWGGQLELLAASKVYRRNITVYSTRLGKVTIEYESPKGSSGPELQLSYHDNEHYNSIRVSSVTKPHPPIKYYVSPYNRDAPMDENDENADVDDSNNMTDDKMAMGKTFANPTVSPRSTPDIEMSETESTTCIDANSKIFTDKERRDKTDSRNLSSSCIQACQIGNEQMETIPVSITNPVLDSSDVIPADMMKTGLLMENISLPVLDGSDVIPPDMIKTGLLMENNSLPVRDISDAMPSDIMKTGLLMQNNSLLHVSACIIQMSTGNEINVCMESVSGKATNGRDDTISTDINKDKVVIENQILQNESIHDMPRMDDQSVQMESFRDETSNRGLSNAEVEPIDVNDDIPSIDETFRVVEI